MRKLRLLISIALIALAALACNLGAVINPESSKNSGSPTTTIVILPEDTNISTAQTVDQLLGPKEEIIHIAQPATGSTFSSPLTINGEADSTFEQNLVIKLSDELGNQLALSPTTIQASLGERGAFSATLTFTIASEQVGRLSVYSQSAMTGGLEHLSSVEITLIPSGSTFISTTNLAAETIGITLPKALDTISSGTIDVKGFSDYFFESSLGLALCGGGSSGTSDELCGTSGNILAMGYALIASPDVVQAGPFTGSLSFSISGTTAGRIVVYATSPRDGGLIHLNSIPVTLQP